MRVPRCNAKGNKNASSLSNRYVLRMGMDHDCCDDDEDVHHKNLGISQMSDFLHTKNTAMLLTEFFV